jgi:hypothetical protein
VIRSLDFLAIDGDASVGNPAAGFCARTESGARNHAVECFQLAVGWWQFLSFYVCARDVND